MSKVMAEERKDKEIFNFDLNEIEEFGKFVEERSSEEEEENKFIDNNDKETPKDEDTNVTLKEGEEDDDDLEARATEDENKEDPSSQETKSDSSHLTPYFKLLVEEGIFDPSDEESWDGTVEGFVNLEQKKLDAWKEKYKTENLHPRVKWLQDNLEEGVPFEELLKLDREVTTLENITEENLTSNIDVQKSIAREYYKETTRFSDERIDREIKRLEDSNELTDESKSFYAELRAIKEEKKTKALEDAKLERQNAEKRQQETITNFKKTLHETAEIIPGRKLTDSIRDKIFTTLTTAVDVDQNGMPINSIAKARAENPLEFEMKLAYLFEITKGFTDWSTIGSTGRKQAYENFEKAARDIDRRDSSSKQNIPSNPSTMDFLNEMEKLQRKGLI